MSGLIRCTAVLVGLAVGLTAEGAHAEDCSVTGAGTLGAGLVEHSCFHASFGPFAEVTATHGSMPSANTADIDPVHTHYSVTIAPDQLNVVTYQPVRTGTWAIFGASDAPHRLLDRDGNEIPVLLTHAVADCPALPVVRVFALTTLERYTLVIGPTSASTTPVVVEKISDFDEIHGRDTDGDGFGNEADSITTPCVPPGGFVRNVADCDDRDPAIHPEAIERCDGIDDNCNGIADEDACAYGGGGCRSGPPPIHDGHGVWILLATMALYAMTRRHHRRQHP